ncbi:hypothetical protein C4B68_26165 [Streptomyces dengpaensis]|uniref:Uncharacterized protein n=2 Tax=Streptomyces TaxID=1883 RepID=A0ABN5I6D2_9ACTN|nr:hypothetical protein C4B68_26165 [Streptomyces dengpaensis]PIB11266.1 hypothetical protein B1C81_05475 [Streptomyces sp. HG99]
MDIEALAEGTHVISFTPAPDRELDASLYKDGKYVTTVPVIGWAVVVHNDRDEEDETVMDRYTDLSPVVLYERRPWTQSDLIRHFSFSVRLSF